MALACGALSSTVSLIKPAHTFRLLGVLWLAAEAAARLSRMSTIGWPKAASDYFQWTLYQMEVDPLPRQFELIFAAMALLLFGLIALWFGRRIGLYLFGAGLVLKLYATYPNVPAILSGLSATLDALSYMLAGFLIGYGLLGRGLATKQADPLMQLTGKEQPAADQEL